MSGSWRSSNEFFREARPDFLEIAYRLAPPAIQEHLSLELAFLEERVPAKGPLLEVGCGQGRVLARLAPRLALLCGVDLNPVYLLRAQREIPSAIFAAADAAALPFVDGTFESSLCVQASLGLLGDKQRAALREMARVTRRGGLVGVVVYSEQSIPSRLEWYSALHREGMMAPVDLAASRGLVTVTRDGHRSEAFTREGLAALFTGVELQADTLPLGTHYYAALARKS